MRVPTQAFTAEVDSGLVTHYVFDVQLNGISSVVRTVVE